MDIAEELYSKYMEDIAFETAKRKKNRQQYKQQSEVLAAKKKIPNEIPEAI